MKCSCSSLSGSGFFTHLSHLICQELFQLEEDVKLLEEMYPQGEKVDT